MICKIAKEMRDIYDIELQKRNSLINQFVKIFRSHGAIEIDTPVAELKELLNSKYGNEGEKLIYDLKDQGGELLCLRYDLTIP